MVGGRRGDLAILCYHAVSDSWPSVGAVAAGVLDRQVRQLLARDYRPSTLSAALASEDDEPVVVVTFDDAFQSVLEHGFPVLEPLGVPATLFVPTDFVAEGAPMTWSTLGQWLGTEHEAELRCMSWDGVRSLAAAGWEIGSHTCSHPKLTEIDRDRAQAELGRSKHACEDALQTPCTALAYPFGLHDPDVVRLAGGAGYECAVTLGERLLGPRLRQDPLRLSREGIYRSTSWRQFLAATSPLLGRVRGSRIFRALAPAP
ncbi:MAG TPA: polysaccharide deacetylase family protein [Solirubrobacterales bacterium]|nr:polysaccharide deacetylase family protein [Solirubrobacterales bacterium]